MRKRKGKNIIWIYFITFILFFSILGVGYGQFNEDLSVDVNITTGYIDPSFDDKESIYEEDLKDITVDEGGTNERDIIIYNNGTIPIILESVECHNGALDLQGTPRGDVIDPKSYETYTVEIHDTEGNHNLKLIFKQHTPNHKKEKTYPTP